MTKFARIKTRTRVRDEHYDNMLDEVAGRYCWYCGRTERHWSDWWGAPWMLERMHLVNKPRKEDRRVVILGCSLCHRLSHGDRISKAKMFSPTLAEMLFLKIRFDREYFDWEFVQGCSVRRLPSPVVPRSFSGIAATNNRKWRKMAYQATKEELEFIATLSL